MINAKKYNFFSNGWFVFLSGLAIGNLPLVINYYIKEYDSWFFALVSPLTFLLFLFLKTYIYNIESNTILAISYIFYCLILFLVRFIDNKIILKLLFIVAGFFSTCIINIYNDHNDNDISFISKRNLGFLSSKILTRKMINFSMYFLSIPLLCSFISILIYKYGNLNTLIISKPINLKKSNLRLIPKKHLLITFSNCLITSICLPLFAFWSKSNSVAITREFQDFGDVIIVIVATIFFKFFSEENLKDYLLLISILLLISSYYNIYIIGLFTGLLDNLVVSTINRYLNNNNLRVNNELMVLRQTFRLLIGVVGNFYKGAIVIYLYIINLFILLLIFTIY